MNDIHNNISLDREANSTSKASVSREASVPKMLCHIFRAISLRTTSNLVPVEAGAGNDYLSIAALGESPATE